jgi:hypothetical protein
VNQVLEVVCQEHQVLPEVRIVVLLEDGKQTGDEVRAIQDNIFLSDQRVDKSVIGQILQGVQRDDGHQEGQLVQVTGERVDLVLWLDVADEL